MSFAESSRGFADLFGDFTEYKSPTRMFLDNLADYLLERKEEPCRKLGRHIKDGGDICLFGVRSDLVGSMAEEMRKADIPFAIIVDAKERIGMLIAKGDTTRTVQAQKQMLKKKTHFLGIVSCNEMLEQKPWMITGLSKETGIVFLNKMRAEFRNLTVGLDIFQDKTCAVCIPPGGADAAKKIGQLLMASVIASHTQPGLTARAVNTFQFQKTEGMGFWIHGMNLDETPMYIVGSDRQYVKITERGCEYGYAERGEIGQTPKLHPYRSIRVGSENYYNDRRAFIAGIPDKTVTYDRAAVMQHFKNTDPPEPDPLMPAIADREWQTAGALQVSSAMLAKLAFDMAADKEAKGDKLLTEMMQNAGKLIDAMILHKSDVDKTMIDRLSAACYGAGLNLAGEKGIGKEMQAASLSIMKSTLTKDHAELRMQETMTFGETEEDIHRAEALEMQESRRRTR